MAGPKIPKFDKLGLSADSDSDDQISPQVEKLPPLTMRLPNKCVPSEPSTPHADINDRETIERLLQENYLYLVNRINPRDFFAYLRQNGSITLADQEEIQFCVTSVDKASKLIDVVLRKDFRCMKAFLSVLEYQYEECFVKLTGLHPGEKPKDWESPRTHIVRNSLSELHNVMKTMSDILQQLTSNKMRMNDLAHQVETAVRTSSEADTEEKQDIIKLKDRIAQLKKENVDLSLENNSLIHRLERERTKTKKLTDADLIIKDLKQGLRQRDADIHRLKTQYMMRDVIKTMRGTKAPADDLHDQVDRLTHQLIEIEAELRNEQSDNKRLKDDVEAMEQQINKSNAEKNKTEETNHFLKSKVDELEQLYWRDRKEGRNKRVTAQGTPKSPRPPAVIPPVHGNIDPVYDTLPSTESEADDNPYSTVADARSLLRDKSDSGTRLQEQFDELSKSLSRLSQNPLTSQISIEEEPNVFYKNVYLDLSSVVKINGENQTLEAIKANILTVQISADVLAQNAKIVGGNHSGVFVSETVEATTGRLEKGYQLTKVKHVSKDDNSAKCLGDCTLEEAHSIIRSMEDHVQIDSLRKQNAFGKFINLTKEYAAYTGDLFCIYISETPQIEEIENALHISAGDVLLVTDTMCNPGYWKARRLDPKTGKELSPLQEGFIQSITLVKTGCLRRHKQEIYRYVQPCQANYQRPLVLCGEESAVTRVIEAIKGDNIFQMQAADEAVSDVVRKLSALHNLDKVMVVSYRHLKEMIKANIYPVVLTINLSKQNQDAFKQVPRYVIENFDVTQYMMENKDEISKNIKDLLQKVQKQIIWRTKENATLPVPPL